MTTTISNFKSVLNSPDNGLALAFEVADELSLGNSVVVNFSSVDRMTPSFSNAFIMTLLDRFPADELRRRVSMTCQNTSVAAAMNESIRRHRNGVRLSTRALAVA